MADLGPPLLTWRQTLRSRRVILVVAVLIGWWVAASVGRLFWNGEVYGLAYPLWYPDGLNYSYRAFIAGGVEPLVATEWLNEMYSDGEPLIAPGVPNSNELVDSRIMFPLVSAPFVRMFGMNGLLVAPALGLLVAVLVPSIMLLRRQRTWIALIGGSLLLASTSMFRWSVANLTDGILIGFLALMLPLLPWAWREVKTPHLVGLAALSIAASLTRTTLPYLLATTGLPLALVWARTRVFPHAWAKACAAVSLPAAVVFVFTFPRTSDFLLPTGQDAGGPDSLSAPARIGQLFLEMFRMSVIELGQLAVLDRALLLLLLLAAIAAFLSPRAEITAVWLGAVAASVFLNAWIGAAGVNFRYAMPLAAVSLLLLGTLPKVGLMRANGQDFEVVSEHPIPGQTS